MKRLSIVFALLILASNQAFGQWSTEALSRARTQVTSVTVGGYTLFAGGYDASGVLDTVDVYEPSTDTWTTASLSVARTAVGATAVAGYALFAGGTNPFNQTTSKVVDIYDSSVGPPSDPAAWSTTTLSSKRGAIAATTVGSKAIFAGGFDALPQLVARAGVDIYDSAIGPPSDPAAWSKTFLSEARNFVAAATVGTKAYFAGGTNFSQRKAVVDVYDSSTGLWSLESLSQPRVLGPNAVTTIGSRIFFAGGLVTPPPSLVTSDVVDIFDTQTGQWSTITMAAGRMGLAMTAAGNDVFIGGGQTNSLVQTDLVEILDTTSLTWNPPCRLSQPRIDLVAITVQGRPMFAGGLGPALSYSDKVDIYQPVGPVPSVELSRLGSPPNPAAFMPGVTSGPIVGSTWDPVIDHSVFATGATFDFIGVSLQGPASAVTSNGTLLVLPPFEGPILFSSPGTPFAIAIPNDCSFVGLNVWTQGGSLSPGPTLELANALDLVLGNE